MKDKKNRLEALRLIISSQQMGSQEELLNALQKEGFNLTQATLSRDLKQLKVAKAATMSGNYVGSSLAIKNGSKFVRPVMAAMIVLLFVKTIYDLLS